MNFLELPVIHFNTEFLDGDYGSDLGYPLDMDVPVSMIRQFYEVRNAVLRVCYPFGTVGCAGDYQWDEEQEGPFLAEAEIIGEECPDFFVADEMWNPVDKYIRVEPNRSNLINLELISSLAEALKHCPEWAVGIYLEDGCVLVFAEKLMVKGPRFQHGFDVASVIATCQAND